MNVERFMRLRLLGTADTWDAVRILQPHSVSGEAGLSRQTLAISVYSKVYPVIDHFEGSDNHSRAHQRFHGQCSTAVTLILVKSCPSQCRPELAVISDLDGLMLYHLVKILPVSPDPLEPKN